MFQDTHHFKILPHYSSKDKFKGISSSEIILESGSSFLVAYLYFLY